LPAQEQYDRAYRIRVATNQSMLHHDLPKAQWMTAKEVCPTLEGADCDLSRLAQDNRYLTPLIEDIVNEEAERASWDGAVISKPKKH
jgi:ubiquinol-cytochrome c reductase subunit 7